MKVTKLGVRLEWMDKDPFRNFKLRFDKFDRKYLTQREIDLIEDTTFTSLGKERVKDVFLFSCYTGLTFMDGYHGSICASDFGLLVPPVSVQIVPV